LIDVIKTFNFISPNSGLMMVSSPLQEIEMSQIRMHKKANFIVHYVINYFHK